MEYGKDLDCPFCGGGSDRPDPTAPHGGMRRCISCGAEAFGQKWNKRAALQKEALAEFDEMKARLAWQRKGTEAVEKCLATAYRGDWQDAPMPLMGDEARLWMRAQAEAYQHAIEMMGYLDNESINAPKVG